MRYLYFYIICLFVVTIISCNHKQVKYFLKKKDIIQIDESKYVFSFRPDHLKVINDSLIIVCVSDFFAIYNYHSGKLIKNFNFLQINRDSLIEKFFQTRYPNRQYIKEKVNFNKKADDKASSLSFLNNLIKGYKVWNFCIKKDTSLIIACSFTTQYYDDVILNKDTLKQITVVDQPCFLIFSDIKFNIKKIIPVFYTAELAPQFGSGMFVKDSFLYVYNLMILLRENIMNKKNKFPVIIKYKITNADTLLFLNAEQIFYAKEELKKAKEKLNNSEENYYNVILWSEFLKKDNTIYVSDSKRLYTLEDGKEIIPNLLDDYNNEYLLTFDWSESMPYLFLYQTFTFNVTANTRTAYLNIFDTKKSQKIYSLKLGETINVSHSAFYKDKVVLIMREGEHYYFKIYELKKDEKS